MRLMLYLQTQPKSLPSAKAIGGVDLQSGLNLGVADHLTLGFVGRIDIGASQYLGLRLNRTQQKHQQAAEPEGAQVFDCMVKRENEHQMLARERITTLYTRNSFPLERQSIKLTP